MKRSLKLLLLAAALLAAPAASVTAQTPPASAASILADPARPAADRARDADRKAAEILAFSGVKPGDKVADIYPGGGYFTRIFSRAVGPTGKVFAVFHREPKTDEITNPAFPNISRVIVPWADYKPAEKLDVIFNSQFYHDYYNPQYGAAGGGPAGVEKVNKTMFDALKPGGLLIIIDHSGRAGTGYSEFNTTHRIDEPVVKSELARAGFVLVGESQVLRNPADPRTANVFDPAIRGKTDQFVLKFRKPN